MQKLVITGARGQLGTQLATLGTAAGLDIVGLASSDLDITDRAAVDRLVEPGSVVINCAAHTAVDAAETDEAAAFAINETGPENLAAACARVGAHLIHISTDYVFDGTADSPYEPDGLPGPVTVYGRSKLAGEVAVHRELPSAQVVRTAWVYTGVGSDFVATMRRLEGERDTVDVVDDQIGSPTYAADLARGLLELAGRPDAPRLLHLTNGGETSWFEFARAVFAGVGADPERVRPCSSAQFVRPAKRPPTHDRTAPSRADAGLTPLRDWRSALASALAELPSNPR